MRIALMAYLALIVAVALPPTLLLLPGVSVSMINLGLPIAVMLFLLAAWMLWSKRFSDAWSARPTHARFLNAALLILMVCGLASSFRAVFAYTDRRFVMPVSELLGVAAFGLWGFACVLLLIGALRLGWDAFPARRG